MVLQREALPEKVANYLRMRILLGEIAEGSHLSEPQLATELSVSRGPIREAMKQLEHEGLTITPSNGRTIAKSYGEQEVRDLFEVRFTLESLAIRFDIKFHHKLVKLTRNRALINSWSQLEGLISSLIEISTGNYTDLTFIVERHEELLDAIEAGDGDQGVALLQQHLDTGERVIIEFIQGQLEGDV